MISFDINHLVPAFLMDDANGRAIAKAIEAAFRYVAGKAEDGIAVIQSPEAMPEWRLDELAWEYNLLYDYDADVEAKRDWIANAISYIRLNGTPAGIKQYLEAMFINVDIKEWFEYHGEPYHFRVEISDAYTAASLAWAQTAATRAKNARSTLDDIRFGGLSVSTSAYAKTALLGMEGTLQLTAGMPDE